MSYRLTWDPDAQVEAARLWVMDPAAVRAATDAAEAALRADPYRAGHHLSEGLWKVVVRPVAVYYRIDPDEQRVTITDVLSAP